MVRRLLPLLLAAAACDSGLEPDTFKRDQPRVEALFDWDGSTVVEAGRCYRLDVDDEKSTPIEVPGLDRLDQLLMRGAVPLALGKGGSRRVLLERGAKDWTEIPLPPPFAEDNEFVRLSAGATSMALVGRRHFYVRRNGEDWRALDIAKPPWHLFHISDPNHIVQMGDLLVLGVNRGTFGGALAEVDLASGAATLVARDLPVRQLAVDGQGRIWAVQGLEYLSAGRGLLRVRENGTWRVFCQVADRGRPALNWTLPPMAFAAVAVDGLGHPWLLGDSVGLIRWNGKAWEQVTREWPTNRFEGALYPVPSTGLRLREGNSALVAMGDAGVALWDWSRPRVRRISLKP